MAFAAFEQVMLFPLNLGMLFGRGSLISERPQTVAVLLCSEGFVSPLSLQQRQRELVPGCPWGILSLGYWPHSLLLAVLQKQKLG